MNTYQLQDCLLKDVFIRRYYGGVLPRNHLPLHIIELPKLYIVNTDPSTEPGEHWLTIWLDESVSEHFDSTGQSPYKDFEDFLILNSKKYKYNHQRLQDFESMTCGQFCLFYSFYRCRNYSLEEILSKFSDDLLSNEVIVQIFFKNVF